MVCEQKVKELEKKMGRKLTPKEKKYVEEKMHHVEQSQINKEEEMIYA